MDPHFVGNQTDVDLKSTVEQKSNERCARVVAIRKLKRKDLLIRSHLRLAFQLGCYLGANESMKLALVWVRTPQVSKTRVSFTVESLAKVRQVDTARNSIKASIETFMIWSPPDYVDELTRGELNALNTAIGD